LPRHPIRTQKKVNGKSPGGEVSGSGWEIFREWDAGTIFFNIDWTPIVVESNNSIVNFFSGWLIEEILFSWQCRAGFFGRPSQAKKAAGEG